MRPREESSGNHDFTHSNGNFYGNFDDTLFHDFHNNLCTCVIAGIRLPVPRGHQRQEMSGPRLFSNNGTDKQEQQTGWKDAARSLPTNPDQFTKNSGVKRLDIDEQYWRVTDANSRVQLDPKSNIGGEQPIRQQDAARTPVHFTKTWSGKRRQNLERQAEAFRNWRQVCADLEDDLLADEVCEAYKAGLSTPSSTASNKLNHRSFSGPNSAKSPTQEAGAGKIDANLSG